MAKNTNYELRNYFSATPFGSIHFVLLFASKKGKLFYGYRTRRSTKNQIDRKIANRIAAKYLLIFSLLNLVFCYFFVKFLEIPVLNIFFVILLF